MFEKQVCPMAKKSQGLHIHVYTMNHPLSEKTTAQGKVNIIQQMVHKILSGRC